MAAVGHRSSKVALVSSHSNVPLGVPVLILSALRGRVSNAPRARQVSTETEMCRFSSIVSAIQLSNSEAPAPSHSNVLLGPAHPASALPIQDAPSDRHFHWSSSSHRCPSTVAATNKCSLEALVSIPSSASQGLVSPTFAAQVPGAMDVLLDK